MDSNAEMYKKKYLKYKMKYLSLQRGSGFFKSIQEFGQGIKAEIQESNDPSKITKPQRDEICIHKDFTFLDWDCNKMLKDFAFTINPDLSIEGQLIKKKETLKELKERILNSKQKIQYKDGSIFEGELKNGKRYQGILYKGILKNKSGQVMYDKSGKVIYDKVIYEGTFDDEGNGKGNIKSLVPLQNGGAISQQKPKPKFQKPKFQKPCEESYRTEKQKKKCLKKMAQKANNRAFEKEKNEYDNKYYFINYYGEVAIKDRDKSMGYGYQGQNNEDVNIYIPHGYGTLIFEDVDGNKYKYIGSFVQGQKDGKGTLMEEEISDGDARYMFCYYGDWKNNKRNGFGHGIESLSDYSEDERKIYGYKGNWINDKSEGFGVYTNDEIKYTGTWKNDERYTGTDIYTRDSNDDDDDNFKQGKKIEYENGKVKK